MNQLTEERRERLKQIRDIVNGPNFYYQGQFYKSRDDQQLLGDALLLLQETFSLLDSDSQAVGMDREAERVAIEGIKEGLRQRDQRAATLMRDKCVEKVREMLSAWKYTDEEVIAALSSLTLDQVKPGEVNQNET